MVYVQMINDGQIETRYFFQGFFSIDLHLLRGRAIYRPRVSIFSSLSIGK